MFNGLTNKTDGRKQDHFSKIEFTDKYEIDQAVNSKVCPFIKLDTRFVTL
jgi:hypothetical protein